MHRCKAGLQKDRDRGTTGPKEGLSPIGRFEQKGNFLFQLYSFLNHLISRKAKMSQLHLSKSIKMVITLNIKIM